MKTTDTENPVPDRAQPHPEQIGNNTNASSTAQQLGFTPGPWVVHESDHADTGLLIEQLGGYVIAECDQLGNMAANAHLIAAAPELYAACRMSDEASTQADLDCACQEVKAALAKARGEADYE